MGLARSFITVTIQNFICGRKSRLLAFRLAYDHARDDLVATRGRVG